MLIPATPIALAIALAIAIGAPATIPPTVPIPANAPLTTIPAPVASCPVYCNTCGARVPKGATTSVYPLTP